MNVNVAMARFDDQVKDAYSAGLYLSINRYLFFHVVVSICRKELHLVVKFFRVTNKEVLFAVLNDLSNTTVTCKLQIILVVPHHVVQVV